MKPTVKSAAAFIVNAWQNCNGEAAYQRYLEHWRRQHASEGQPLSRKAFFAAETQRKWNGIKRCC
ncbi:YbdD/YjiX family protein [Methylomonas sp. SURF-2]|uniref:YbdD/YjiX family protein n=1 Tax=Methylomonas subterranea TaxID=2952225 RepID=A0ABT1TB12_9GAMM|nr:YbdD/YjiX family protein [Methylomonas sp. SURF-2]MCQ8102652.1 YbdD/YjiX family protein [Methylomonas sp. SURF-2]